MVSNSSQQRHKTYQGALTTGGGLAGWIVFKEKKVTVQVVQLGDVAKGGCGVSVLGIFQDLATQSYG